MALSEDRSDICLETGTGVLDQVKERENERRALGKSDRIPAASPDG
jgi:hypothetical protein